MFLAEETTNYLFMFSISQKQKTPLFLLLPFGVSIESESESCLVMSDSLRPHGPYSPWNSPGQTTGVSSRSLLQGIFPTYGWNPRLPHRRTDSLPAEPLGSVPRGNPKQSEIQISAPYRLRSAPAVAATLRDPPQVNKTFILRAVTALATPD